MVECLAPSTAKSELSGANPGASTKRRWVIYGTCNPSSWEAQEYVDAKLSRGQEKQKARQVFDQWTGRPGEYGAASPSPGKGPQPGEQTILETMCPSPGPQ